MSFPFSAEGSIEVPISSPEKAPLVAEGLLHWLTTRKACDMQCDGSRIQFSGHDYDWGCRHFGYRPLTGIGKCQLTLRPMPAKVVIGYRISFHAYPTLLVGFALLLGVAVSSIEDPRLLLILPLAFLVSYGLWAVMSFGLQSDFRTAAIRGLADGAERELMALRAR